MEKVKTSEEVISDRLLRAKEDGSIIDLKEYEKNDSEEDIYNGPGIEEESNEEYMYNGVGIDEDSSDEKDSSDEDSSEEIECYVKEFNGIEYNVSEDGTIYNEDGEVIGKWNILKDEPREECIMDKNKVYFRMDGKLYRLKRERMPGDGNCMFHSISYHLNKELSAKRLREMTINYMDINSNDYEPFITDESWSEYLKRMSKNKSWGGNMELTAMSKMLLKTIYVCEHGRKPIKIGEDYDDRIYILYCKSSKRSIKSNHYDTLIESDRYT